MTEYDGQAHRPTLETELTRQQSDEDEGSLRAGLIGLASMVAGGRAVDELLAEVAEFAASAIPGVEGAGVTLVAQREGEPYVAAWSVTADFVREIDVLQYEILHEGPCTSCMQSRRPVVSGSLGSDRRWPRFGGRVARIGVHSALALPLLVADQVVGAINGYARPRDAFTEHAVRLGAQFAGPAAVSVYNAELLARLRDRAEKLQTALGSRAVINQAIGIIRSRSGGSAEEAFARLRHISQAENVKLNLVAQRLVDEAVRRAHARQR
jgi:GAF domain-containing protein